MAGNSGASGCSNFENATHQALYDMVAGGDHMHLSFTGASLVQAGKEIEQIATELKALAEGVPWEGEGALAFREWSNGTVKESHKLARFASTTGNALSDAGSALWEAKAMPQPKQTYSVQLDSAATPTARGAKGAPLMTDPDREAAVAAMNRLASYYRTAQQNIESQERPNFQPASGFVPNAQGGDAGRDAMYVLDQPSRTATANGAAEGQTVPVSGISAAERHTAASEAPVSVVQHDRQVGTAVNSTAPVATPGTKPSQGGPVPPQPWSPGIPSGLVVAPPATFPGTAKAPSGNTNTTRGPLTEAARPEGATPRRFSSVPRDGIVGTGAQRGGTATARPQLPSETTTGTERGTIPPRPAGPSAASPAANRGPATGGAGNSGQRLASPDAAPMDKSRGVVMGEERAAMRHGPTGSSYPGSASSTNPATPGRRWAYEPGGTVGAASGGSVIGAEQPPGSAMGRAGSSGVAEGTVSGTRSVTGRSSTSELGEAPGRVQAPRGRATDFTPGGSGLARANPTSDILPMPGTPSTSRGRRGAAERPDYLQEDAETWTAQHRSVVPPVIE
ncbi:hypothetical protein [Streptomyces sp. NPDC093707]|uniref:hypothetical protein n=1 Tax=Streptomyces sp. NPDC093707 TaxID=3154984 RepID=UPI00344DE80C